MSPPPDLCAILPPMSGGRASGQIIVCEQRYAVDAPVVNWQDDGRFSAYWPCCYSGKGGAPPSPYPWGPATGMEKRRTRYRPRKELVGKRGDIATLKRIIRQCVIHHDGAESSLQCFDILHNERGLSAHFLVDGDGTIYQTLDLADAAFHAHTANGYSIGIEVCNRGKVSDSRKSYSPADREPQQITIHSHPYTAWSFTRAQYRSLAALLKTLLRIFPRLPCCYPTNGGLIQTVLAEPEKFMGILGHYHLSLTKWDPGPFDFDLLIRSASARSVWFAAAPRVGDRRSGSSAVVPVPILGAEVDPGRSSSESASAQQLELLRRNEEQAAGGHFPIGPCGQDVVWHGGVHVILPPRAPLFAPLPGRVVAARLERSDGVVGSSNFVLVRHDLSLRGRTQSVFLLLFHLERLTAEDPAARRLPWLSRLRGEQPNSAAGRATGVWFPDAEVAAGEVLGLAGLAGPSSRRETQVHVELLAAQDVTAAVSAMAFQPLDCGSDSLVCLTPQLSRILGVPSLEHLYSRETGRPKKSQLAALRKLAVRAPSEWRVRSEAEWNRCLAESRALRLLSSRDRRLIYCEQIAPNAWLDEAVARRVGLPIDGIVWHYHPIEFLAFVAAELSSPGGTGGVTARAAETTGTSVPANDGATGTDSYVTEEDLSDGDFGEEELKLEDIAAGYPAHWLHP